MADGIQETILRRLASADRACHSLSDVSPLPLAHVFAFHRPLLDHPEQVEVPGHGRVGENGAASSRICLPAVAPRDVVQHQVLDAGRAGQPGRLAAVRWPKAAATSCSSSMYVDSMASRSAPATSCTRSSTRPASPTKTSRAPAIVRSKHLLRLDRAPVGQGDRRVPRPARAGLGRPARPAPAAFSARNGRRAFSSKLKPNASAPRCSTGNAQPERCHPPAARRARWGDNRCGCCARPAPKTTRISSRTRCRAQTPP